MPGLPPAAMAPMSALSAWRVDTIVGTEGAVVDVYPRPSRSGNAPTHMTASSRCLLDTPSFHQFVAKPGADATARQYA